MKVLFQFLVILVFSLAGELLHIVIPLPVPASVYGLILLFVCLLLKVVKLSQIEDAADFLLQIMPALFIAAAVSLMTIWDTVLQSLVPLLVIVLVSTVAVMAVTGRTAQWMIRRKEGRREKENE